MKKENGITLIALVVTIIILLILAGISVAVMTGENGIINKGNIAKEITKIEEYREDLQLIGEGLQPDKVIEELSSKEYMDRYEKEINEENKYKKVTRKDDETIIVTSKEGYVYKITTDKVEYLGKEGEITPPNLQESDIEFRVSPSKWTNKEVTVEIEKKNNEIKEYNLQYSSNGETWENYIAPITVTSNSTIYARLINNIGQPGGYATGNVENIDKLAPNNFTPTATSTTNSITLAGSTQDQEKTETDGSSGISKYYFSNDDGATWLPTNGQTGTSYTFTKLPGGITYNLKMKAVDNVGNETVTETVSKKVEGAYVPTRATIIEPGPGLVIKDSNQNEWVWIEVPKSIYTIAKSSTDYTNIEKDMQNYAKDYRQDGYSDTFYSTEQHGFANATEYNNWKNDMLESVFTNGGFYIGRYEIGTDSTSVRTSSSGISAKPYIKQDMIPYIYIKCSEAQILSKQLSTGGKQASLMFGIQWDLVMKFIETKGGKTQEELKTNSGTWGNFRDVTFDVTQGKYLSGSTWSNITTYTKPASEVLLSTGATARNRTLNIYDLAGNVYEWTLEKTSTSGPCTGRGGGCNGNGSACPASYRANCNTNYSTDHIGTRPTLW